MLERTCKNRPTSLHLNFEGWNDTVIQDFIDCTINYSFLFTMFKFFPLNPCMFERLPLIL